MTSTMTEPLELLPGRPDAFKPAFESREAYEEFRRAFAHAVRPALDQYRIARSKSEEAARHHRVY